MKLKSALLVCVVVSVANLLEARATNGTDEMQKEQRANCMRNRRLLKTEGLTCEPKIRLAYISDHPDADPAVVYDPLAAVLHLCDSAGGYCGTNVGHRCKPSAEEEVEIVFNARNSGKGQPILQAFKFTNHTKCSCMK